MKKISFLLFFVFLTSFIFSQSDTIPIEIRGRILNLSKKPDWSRLRLYSDSTNWTSNNPINISPINRLQFADGSIQKAAPDSSWVSIDTQRIDADSGYYHSLYIRDTTEVNIIKATTIGYTGRCTPNMWVKNINGCGGTVNMTTGVTIEDSLIYNNSPSDGYVLTSDVNGYATWQAPATELLTFDVTIPHDSILIMYTRPQELIAAPGANKLIVPVSIAAYYYYNGVAYATNTSSFFYIGSLSISASNINLSSTESKIFTMPLYLVNNYTASNLLGYNFNIRIDTDNPTGGTAGNYIRIKGKYYIEDFN